MFKKLLGRTKVIVIAVTIIFAFRWIGGLLESNDNAGGNSAPIDNADRRISIDYNQSSEPLAVYVQAPSNGMTEKDFNISYASSLEIGATESLREKYSRNYKDASGKEIDPSSLNVDSRSVITEVNGKRIIVITTRISVFSSPTWKPQGMFVKVVMLDEKTLHQVACAGTGSSDFNIWSGTCGEKIKQSFGISLPN